MANISVYGSHNASFVIEDKGKILYVIEVERALNYKNSGLAQYKVPRPTDILYLPYVLSDLIYRITGFSEFETCYRLNTDVIIDEKCYDLVDSIKAKKFVEGLHHESHAAGAFYQSPYKEALVFSFDGGGNDGCFNIYHATRKNSVQLLKQVILPNQDNPHVPYDLGFPYMVFAHYLKDIRYADLGDGNLEYPGKVMGLASYGKVRKKWLKPFIDFYKTKPDGTNYQSKLDILGKKIGIEFSLEKRLEGQVAYDIAATSQRAFEECFLEQAIPFFEKYPNLPICVTGGCGLNIILNTRLVQEFNKKVFVGPNPNDCGLAAGLLLHHIRPAKAVDLTYSGTELLDINSLGNQINTLPVDIVLRNLDTARLVSDLKEGKIVGVARGRSEHGPRALGNRSILCNPFIPEMKDILNEKVKHREWYRPFAPVVRLEDVSTYFEWKGESRWMSFCPKVKKKWREKLSAITHIDGTARVQTVTREQNEWLYDLLTEFKKETGVGVLLNTSFNVAGKPILSTVKDALSVFQESLMDTLVVENFYLIKIDHE